MTGIQDILSLGTMLVMFGLIAATVMKVFQIATDIRESKDLLRDIRRNTQNFAQLSTPQPHDMDQAPAIPGAGFARGVPTPEELVRAVHAQKFDDDEFPL